MASLRQVHSYREWGQRENLSKAVLAVADEPQLANAQRQETAQIMKDLQQFLEKHQGAYDKALKVYYGESE